MAGSASTSRRSTGSTTAGGWRRTSARPARLAALHPGIADGLLSSARVRKPERTFSLFTWLNNGGLIMDWLIAGIEETDAEADRVPTGVASIAALAQRLNLSRTHLTRKLKDAEALGSIGWQGKRGESVMWVSSGFRREYATAQAVKLAIIDDAVRGLLPAGAGRSGRGAGRSGAGNAEDAASP